MLYNTAVWAIEFTTVFLIALYVIVIGLIYILCLGRTVTRNSTTYMWHASYKPLTHTFGILPGLP